MTSKMSQFSYWSPINNLENATRSNEPQEINPSVPAKYPNFTIILEERPEPGDLWTIAHVGSATEILLYDVVFMIPSNEGTTKHSEILLPPLEYVIGRNRHVIFLALPLSFMNSVWKELKKTWIGMGRLEKIKPYDPWKMDGRNNSRAPEGFEFCVAIRKEKLANLAENVVGTYDGALSFSIMKRLINGAVHVEFVTAFSE